MFFHSATKDVVDVSVAHRCVPRPPASVPKVLPFLVAALGLALNARAAHIPQRYEGSAYSSDGSVLLYRETHWLYRDGGVDKRLVLYRCADGTPFARKLLSESPSASAPDFDFYDARLEYREGVKTVDGRRIAYYKKQSDAVPAERELVLDANDVIDAGFDAYVLEHWDQISPAVPLHAAIVVPGRLATMPVTITEAKPADIDVRHLIMRLDTWFGFVVQPISIDYERSDRRLIAFQGIGTIRDASGRNMNVRIRFPSEQRHSSIDPMDVAAALQAPLNPRCNR